MKINELIKSKRIEMGLTLEDVGKKVGVGKSTVRKWETGDIESMRSNKISLLASVLDISPLSLLGIEEIEITDKHLVSSNDYSGSFIITPEVKLDYNDLTPEGKKQFAMFLKYLQENYLKEGD